MTLSDGRKINSYSVVRRRPAPPDPPRAEERTNGTGAYTRCDARLSVDYDRYGPWVRVGKTSTAVCNVWSGDRAFNSTVQVH